MRAGKRLYYGWAVVAAVFAMLAVTAGLAFYGTTVYLRAFAVEQGFSVGSVSAATAVFFVVSGSAGLPIAWLLDRYDPRITITLGALFGGTALALLGHVNALWQLFAVYALLGVGYAGAALVPGTTIVTRWFARRRSVALSVASTGLSIGGIVLTPLVATMISRFGLAAVAPWIGVAFVVGIVPVTLAVVRPWPASVGLEPDGDTSPEASATSAAGAGTPLRAVLLSRFFVLVSLTYVLVMFAQVGGLAHHFNLVSERIDEARGAIAVSTVATASVIARLIGGWVVTRVSLRRVTGTLMVIQGVALVGMGASDTYTWLLAFSVAFGATIGNLLMFHPLLLADAYGVRDYSRIYAISLLVMTIGLALGPASIGLGHDLVGGYELPFVLAGVASFGSAATLAAAGPTARAAPGRRGPG